MEKKAKKNDQIEEYATKSKAATSKIDRQSTTRKQFEENDSSDENDDDLPEELKDLYSKNTVTKHNIEKNISELALSTFKRRME